MRVTVCFGPWESYGRWQSPALAATLVAGPHLDPAKPVRSEAMQGLDPQIAGEGEEGR